MHRKPNTPEVLKLLYSRFGEEVDGDDYEEYRPLMWAVMGNDHIVVEQLLLMGAGVWYASKRNMRDGILPFTHAVKTNDITLMKLLLASADPDQETYQPEPSLPTPLTRALLNNNQDMVQLLLDEGSDVNPLDKDTQPLPAAVQNCSWDVINILLERGSNVNYMHRRTRDTPLSLAGLYRDEPIVRLLLNHGAHMTPKVYHNASVRDCRSITSLLMRKWMPPDTTEVLGLSSQLIMW
ncbi:hypothetical protein AJ79_04723 [Helicocarpus griseus UAMH5409]|uniref:Uncharacterized protein n=1 Tax=Helicocarpus griseus UAMH5409 TaxID=1447875 RepID=A0A2B7XRU7_9EURO|nr:hypothetical protein AJ79_04723 [Helicocarpus griseus UAMH5409]